MAWAGFSILTNGATLSFTGISLDEYGASPLVVFSDQDLTTEITFPLDLTSDPTMAYLDLGAASSEYVWLTFGQADGSAINVSKQATPNMTIEVTPTPSYDQVVEDVSDITGAISDASDALELQIGQKADLIGDEDIVISTASAGIVLADTASVLWRISVNVDGSLATTEVTP